MKDVEKILNNKRNVANVDVYMISAKDGTATRYSGLNVAEEIFSKKTKLVQTTQALVTYNTIEDIIKDVMMDTELRDAGVEEKEIIKIKQKLLENKEKIKNILEKNRDFANLGDPTKEEIGYKEIEQSPNTIVLPYLIISLGNPTEAIKKELVQNKESLAKILDFEKTYRKQLNWIHSASEEKLSRIDLPKKFVRNAPVSFPIMHKINLAMSE
jgi:hypothetical protein